MDTIQVANMGNAELALPYDMGEQTCFRKKSAVSDRVLRFWNNYYGIVFAFYGSITLYSIKFLKSAF